MGAKNSRLTGKNKNNKNKERYSNKNALVFVMTSFQVMASINEGIRKKSHKPPL